MKFLEDEKLERFTAALTDVSLGTGERVISGRIEAFTMKRAGTDKKYAHALGAKYEKEIKVEEDELAQFKKALHKRRNRSASFSEHCVGSSTDSTTFDSTIQNKKNCTGTSSTSMIGKSNDTVSENKNGATDQSIEDNISRNVKFPKGTIAIDAAKTMMSTPSKTTRSNNEKTRRRRSQSVDLYPSKGGGVLKKSRHPQQRCSRSDSFDTPYSQSPLGDFHDSCTRRLMTDLILTLNASFPDYDFSSVRPAHFARIPRASIAMNRTNERLSDFAACACSSSSSPEMVDVGGNFLVEMWKAIDEVIVLSESEVYSYVPPSRDDDDDPLGFLTQTIEDNYEAGSNTSVIPLWTFNFFFVNKSLKRIVLFTCAQAMRNGDGGDEEEEEELGYNAITEDRLEENVRPNTNMMVGGSHSLLYQQSMSFGGGYLSGNISSANEDEDGLEDFDMDTDNMGQAVPTSAPPTAIV